MKKNYDYFKKQKIPKEIRLSCPNLEFCKEIGSLTLKKKEKCAGCFYLYGRWLRGEISLPNDIEKVNFT